MIVDQLIIETHLEMPSVLVKYAKTGIESIKISPIHTSLQ